MRKYLTLAAAAALGITTLCGSASAQGVGIYVGPSGGGIYSDYDEPGYAPYAYGPRVYGYTRRADDVYGDEVRVRRSYRSGGCGTYRYWNGDRCVDARYER